MHAAHAVRSRQSNFPDSSHCWFLETMRLRTAHDRNVVKPFSLLLALLHARALCAIAKSLNCFCRCVLPSCLRTLCKCDVEKLYLSFDGTSVRNYFIAPDHNLRCSTLGCEVVFTVGNRSEVPLMPGVRKRPSSARIISPKATVYSTCAPPNQ